MGLGVPGAATYPGPVLLPPFHLSDRPDRALNAYQTGVYANEDRGRGVANVLGDVGFEVVAVNIEDVLRRVNLALSGDTLIDLDKVLDTYMGTKTAGGIR